MSRHQPMHGPDLGCRETLAINQLNGIKPEFSGLFPGNHMDVRRLAGVSLVAVKEKPIAIRPENAWHITPVAPGAG